MIFNRHLFKILRQVRALIDFLAAHGRFGSTGDKAFKLRCCGVVAVLETTCWLGIHFGKKHLQAIIVASYELRVARFWFISAVFDHCVIQSLCTGYKSPTSSTAMNMKCHPILELWPGGFAALCLVESLRYFSIGWGFAPRNSVESLSSDHRLAWQSSVSCPQNRSQSLCNRNRQPLGFTDFHSKKVLYKKVISLLGWWTTTLLALEDIGGVRFPFGWCLAWGAMGFRHWGSWCESTLAASLQSSFLCPWARAESPRREQSAKRCFIVYCFLILKSVEQSQELKNHKVKLVQRQWESLAQKAAEENSRWILVQLTSRPQALRCVLQAKLKVTWRRKCLPSRHGSFCKVDTNYIIKAYKTSYHN